MPYIAASIPEVIRTQASYLGIRSEAFTFENEPSLAKIPVDIDSQRQLGSRVQTKFHFQNHDLISTGLKIYRPQLQPKILPIARRGCYLFSKDGTCIWEGDAT